MSSSYCLANDTVVCHAFNKDASQVAVAVNTNDVYILSCPTTKTGKFKVVNILKEHTSNVLHLDWAPNSDRIVSCSADRNAYVWQKQNDGKWKPKFVMLQLSHAATCTMWSPLENKFIVGSGSKLVAICYYDETQDWWLSKHITKKIKSTVTCVDWHPNNCLIACGSTDFRVRVFAASIKNVDTPTETNWGSKMTFGALLFESGSGESSWVHSVSFSADGNRLAWVTHNSRINVADVSSASSGAGDSSAIVTTTRLKLLPLLSCIWTAADQICAAGHDCAPYLFSYKNSTEGPRVMFSLDKEEKSASAAPMTAMDKFKGIDRTATSDVTSRLNTTHQNTINELRIMTGTKASAKMISSIGRDGWLVTWDLPTLIGQMKS